jgi:ABC-type polysaccharide/polyol phosphate transport system ATPase subunit
VPQNSVIVSHIGKRYRIGAAPASYRTFRETLIDTFTKPKKRLHGKMTDANSFWALKDISFNVEKGWRWGSSVAMAPEKAHC